MLTPKRACGGTHGFFVGCGSLRALARSRRFPRVPRLQRKSFATPDQTRGFPTGRVDVVNLDETAVCRFTFQPGWRWAKDVAPIAGTTSCQHRHVGREAAEVAHHRVAAGIATRQERSQSRTGRGCGGARVQERGPGCSEAIDPRREAARLTAQVTDVVAAQRVDRDQHDVR